MAEVDYTQFKGLRIGRILTKMGKVKRAQVHEGLELQKQRRGPLGQILIDLGYVSEDDVTLARAAQDGMQVIDLEDFDIPNSVLKQIPAEMANAYQVLPLMFDEQANTLTVALKSADNFRAVDDLRLLMGFNVEAMVAPAEQIASRIKKLYGDDEGSIADLIGELSEADDIENIDIGSESVDLEELVQMAEDNRVKRLLNLVLLQAIKDKASDIHFEPFEDEFKMRYRIDGVLYEMIPPPMHLATAIVSRIKVMAGLDIAERRMPQDGRIELVVNSEPVDLRIAVLPTMFGESCVMRVLDRSNVNLDLEQVGLREDDLNVVRQLIHKPNGIVIVTGPTGSGKTTTLYSALSELNTITEKILTAEDPVEYDIDGLCQVQINPAQGLTFGKALKSFLRQDPDIILVGETRDLETAQIAVQASLTGHLVFTTLHTNDAPSSIARLVDLGLDNFLVTATLEGIIAQRLVRKICTRCKQEYQPTEEELMKLEIAPDEIGGRSLFRGKGCDFCNHSGFKGRLGIFEIMVLNDELRDMIMNNSSSQQLMNKARRIGMRTLRQSGMLALFDGLTTIDEVVRETLVAD